MELKMTSRAKEKGIRKVEMIHMHDFPNYIVGIMHESRNKSQDKIDWVDPVVFFKSDIKHADYDRVKKIAEASGLLLLFPDASNFRTDYYSLECNGLKKMIKSWGYASNNLPPKRRWNQERIEEAASKWISGALILAEIIDFIYGNLNEGDPEEILIEKVQVKYSDLIA